MCKTPTSQVAYNRNQTVWLITCIAQVHVAIAPNRSACSPAPKQSKLYYIALARSAFMHSCSCTVPIIISKVKKETQQRNYVEVAKKLKIII